MTTVQINARDAFLAALILTGSFEAAERAVSEPIATSEMRSCRGRTAHRHGEARGSNRR